MNSREVVGFIPAGGQASRIAPLPCSKELFPVGLHTAAEGRGSPAKVVAHYLLEKMRFAGITNAYIVLRPRKWDIPAYFRDASYRVCTLPISCWEYHLETLPFTQNGINGAGR